jgi:RecB family endonuclease NucS
VLIERNMEVLFGVRLVASEHSTGKRHGGRIDPLGLDENGSPVIFEYKRSQRERDQPGRFYVDWPLDHRAEFERLVMRKFGSEAAAHIVGKIPKVDCCAYSCRNE